MLRPILPLIITISLEYHHEFSDQVDLTWITYREIITFGTGTTSALAWSGPESSYHPQTSYQCPDKWLISEWRKAWVNDISLAVNLCRTTAFYSSS